VTTVLAPRELRAALAASFSGSFALAAVIVPVLVLTAVVLLLGPEAKGKVFGAHEEEHVR
jgi:hypothetical protein